MSEELIEYLKPAAKALLDDDKNWTKESVSPNCKVCGVPAGDDEIPFLIYKQVGQELWSMTFHYGCAFVEEKATEYEAEQLECWLFEE